MQSQTLHYILDVMGEIGPVLCEAVNKVTSVSLDGLQRHVAKQKNVNWPV